MPGRGAEEIRKGLWRLYEPFGGRMLAYYALRRPSGWTLVDAGLPGLVTKRLDEGTWQGPIDTIIVPHADADHLGDVANLKTRYPELTVCCHPADRTWIADHDLLAKERYDHARERLGFH
jgi:glyoxylase-like metal-dependent hydrolase (beta-lactamase superfamily II)